MSKQSWTAWLLDSYASSVSHVPSDYPDRDNIDPETVIGTSSSPNSYPSSAISMGSSSSHISPSGPYVRTGRGGAGNFHWNTDRDEPTTDVESQKSGTLLERRKAAAKLDRIETSDAVAKRAISAPFTLVGRGGAGNYTQSNEIQSAKSPRSASTTYTPSTSTPTFGRGGAGNMTAAMDAKAKAQCEKDDKEREEADRRRVQIEQQVAGLLQPPAGAIIATGSRRSSLAVQDVTLDGLRSIREKSTHTGRLAVKCS